MLRSVKQLYGDKLAASDGEIGQVKEFCFDDQSWVVGGLAIKTGHRLSGKEVQIPTTTSRVARISYEESTVFVKMTGEAVEQSPAHHLASNATAD